ncbi:hypothetical protein CAPTEDRAFT_196777 [Capitella teleta]|uniref:Sulfotransferase domain-containing protein n=1 Tax=Capitella teleta TaxID=283909 RepID=R7TN10_CAPTE|nr:hypothetical protein CAPTEDRAFT_196777 [Capitella teleta]|eukprot:ELT92470.1 hypothetical protein CAPTEDRAFT_196777 [Capitella teleta]
MALWVVVTSSEASKRVKATGQKLVNNEPKVERDVASVEHKKRVLMLTYMRGGSTFLGELFNQHPDAFYWFEPLHNYQLTRRPPHTSPDLYLFNNGSESSILTPEELQAHVDIIRKTVTCDLQSLPLYIFADIFLTDWQVPQKMKNYRKCMDGKNKTVKVSAEFKRLKNFNRIYNLTPRDLDLNFDVIEKKIESEKDSHFLKPKKATDVFPFKVQSCIHLLEEPCKQSKVIAIKSIRYAAEFIPRLGDDIDKVIHLSRDPRGIINSRDGDKLDAAKKVNQYLCYHMLADVQSRKKQEIRNPNLYFSLKYEDFAANTMGYAKRLYEFVGLVNNNATLQRIVAMTHTRKDNGPIGTSRKISTATASAWRSKLAPEVIKIITEKCAEVLSQYGYIST